MDLNMIEKKVAVIGAGASGLAAIKCCLDEGLNPDCFERTDYISGLWHYTEDIENGQACVMKSTVINTSKEMMCYSDFPIPKEFAIYMHNKYVDKYFHLYADNFNLKKHINFNTEVNAVPILRNSFLNDKLDSEYSLAKWVISVVQSTDFDQTGKWELKLRNTKSNEEETRIYDGVLVCTGHHAEKNMPSFKRMEKFQGKIVHTHDYKDHRGYEDKRVVVVGIGNSGGDVSVELSKISSQVFLSTRRGSWIFNRVGDKGDPGDTVFSRFFADMLAVFPSIRKGFKKRLNDRFDHKKFSLQPNHDPFSQHPTVNDELPNRIISGNVIIKPNIREFTETGVIFEDGTHEQVDVVIMATGYIFGFPFLDKTVTEVKDNQINLYKYMFPPDLQKNTLAVIGCIQPIGAIMPISELQCRLATRVIKGEVSLPNRSDMWTEIRLKQQIMSQRYVKSTRHTIQVDYVPFMDELAVLTGCKPNLKSLLLTDPKLALRCYFGPCTPYQYRIMGPGAWKGSREAILTVWDRYAYPLNTRPCNVDEEKSGGTIYVIAIALLAIFMYFVFAKFL